MPTFLSAATTNLSGTTVSPAAPAGVADGNLLLAVYTTDSDHIITAVPSGWTQVGATQSDIAGPPADSSTSVFYKVASGEGATLAGPTFSLTENGLCAVLAFTDVNPSAPINVSAQDTGASGTQPSPSITTTVNGCLIVAIYGTDPAAGQAGTPETTPHAATELVDAINGTNGYIFVQAYAQPTAGTISLTPASITADNYSRFALALAPAAATTYDRSGTLVVGP